MPTRTPAARLRTVAGFTLIELLVVLTIVGLLVAVAAPLIASALPGAELSAAAQRLAAHLRQTRSEAIFSSRETALVLDVDTRSYHASGEERTHRLPGGVQLTFVAAESQRVAASAGAIRFYPDGSSTGGRITLADGKRERGVDVDWLTGRVSVRN